MIFTHTRNTLIATAIFSSAAIACQSVRATTQAEIQPLIQENYNRINAAFIRKNVNEATTYFTSDYISINTKGEKQNLAQFRQHYNNLFNRLKINLTANKTTIKDIALKPNGVEVSIEQHTEAKVMGNKIVIQQTSKNFWLKTVQGWRLKQSHILTNQTTFNGKTFKG